MSVKIFIRRRFNRDRLKDAGNMLIEARSNAMESKGYISTETLVDYDDPLSVVIVSMWQSKEDWDTYRYSAARRELEEKWAKLLDAPTQYEIFKMGMP